MIDYNDEYCSFHVDHISVTFSDGVTFNTTNTTTTTTTTTSPSSSNSSKFVTITSTPTTPLGYEWKITFFNKDDDGNDYDNEQPRRRIIRLYVITPNQDWRRISSTTITGYGWKLNSAWMSSDEEYDWLHWNLEGHINSQIQVPKARRLRRHVKEEEEDEFVEQEEQKQLVEQQEQQHELDNGIKNDSSSCDDDSSAVLQEFECDEMVFHFESIDITRHDHSNKRNETKVLIMTNVQLGCDSTALLMSALSSTSAGTTTTTTTATTSSPGGGGGKISSNSNNDEMMTMISPNSNEATPITTEVQLYRPCPPDIYCRIVDGQLDISDPTVTTSTSSSSTNTTITTTSSFMAGNYALGTTVVGMIYVIVVVVAVVTIRSCIMKRRYSGVSNKTTVSYQRIDPTLSSSQGDDDDDDDVEDMVHGNDDDDDEEAEGDEA